MGFLNHQQALVDYLQPQISSRINKVKTSLRMQWAWRALSRYYTLGESERLQFLMRRTSSIIRVLVLPPGITGQQLHLKIDHNNYAAINKFRRSREQQQWTCLLKDQRCIPEVKLYQPCPRRSGHREDAAQIRRDRRNCVAAHLLVLQSQWCFMRLLPYLHVSSKNAACCLDWLHGHCFLTC